MSLTLPLDLRVPPRQGPYLLLLYCHIYLVFTHAQPNAIAFKMLDLQIDHFNLVILSVQTGMNKFLG